MVPRPEGEHIIDTKWIFHNKIDEEGNVIRNKAWLVAQGYSQMEEVDYDETFAPVTRMESIRILLALACQLKFKLFQGFSSLGKLLISHSSCISCFET